ncbi:hypothetical protein BC936DRAFT_141454, partial [Jimgerdemannia flammicorona]
TNVLWFATVGHSLIGEVRISKFLLESISTKGDIVRSYRTGHLLYPNEMPDIWEQNGIKYSSTGAANDQNTNLPYQLFSNRGYSQEVDVFEFCMTTSDEDLDPINGVWALPGTGNYTGGSALYKQYTLVHKIAKYGGSYTFLLHPTSFGAGIPWATRVQLFSDKLDFQNAFHPLVRNISYFDTMGGRGDFTKARLNAGIDWTISGTTVNAIVKLPMAIKNLTLNYPTTWKLVQATTAVSVPVPGAVILSGFVAPGTYTLIFSTASTTSTLSAPTVTPNSTFAITTSVAHPIPVPAVPARVVVDDFSDPVRYNNQNNSLHQYTYDDNTMRDRSTVWADWLLLEFSNASYWYSLLGPNTECNDYSHFTNLNVAFRFPGKKAYSFNVNLQDAVPTACGTVKAFNAVAVGPNTTYALTDVDTWQQLTIPLTVFGANLTALKSVTFNKFPGNGIVEVDYIYIS